MSGGRHVTRVLAALTAGTLPPGRAAAVRAHLAACAACRAEGLEWEAVAQAVRSDAQDLPAPNSAAADRTWAEIGRRRARGLGPGRGGIRRALSLGAQVAAAQFRVLRRALFLPPLASTAVGAALALLGVRGGHAAEALGVLFSIGGGLGGALCVGPDAEPNADLAASVPIRPRLVLAARLGAVFGVNAAAGIVASALLVGAHAVPLSVGAVADLWLGPMLVLGAFSAVLAALWGTMAATTGTVLVWAVRLFAGGPVASAWHTSTATLAAAAALAALSLAIGTRVPRTV